MSTAALATNARTALDFTTPHGPALRCARRCDALGFPFSLHFQSRQHFRLDSEAGGGKLAQDVQRWAVPSWPIANRLKVQEGPLLLISTFEVGNDCQASYRLEVFVLIFFERLLRTSARGKPVAFIQHPEIRKQFGLQRQLSRWIWSKCCASRNKGQAPQCIKHLRRALRVSAGCNLPCQASSLRSWRAKQ